MLRHGHRRGGNARRSPTYQSWRAMIERCSYPRHPYYPIYGGRGITICEQWRGRGGFEQFLADLGERPSGLTLDRHDPDGNYEPANCRWATPLAQRWNRRDMAAARAELASMACMASAQSVPASAMPF